MGFIQEKLFEEGIEINDTLDTFFMIFSILKENRLIFDKGRFEGILDEELLERLPESIPLVKNEANLEKMVTFLKHNSAEFRKDSIEIDAINAQDFIIRNGSKVNLKRFYYECLDQTPLSEEKKSFFITYLLQSFEEETDTEILIDHSLLEESSIHADIIDVLPETIELWEE